MSKESTKAAFQSAISAHMLLNLSPEQEASLTAYEKSDERIRMEQEMKTKPASQSTKPNQMHRNQEASLTPYRKSEERIRMEQEYIFIPLPPKKEEFGLDSRVTYRGYDNIFDLMVMGLTFILLVQITLALIFTNDVVRGFIVIALFQILWMHPLIARMVRKLKGSRHVRAFFYDSFHWLEANERYKRAYISWEFEKKDIENQRKRAREEQIRRAKIQEIYEKRLGRQRQLEDSFNGIGTARATAEELLLMFDSDKGQDLEVLVKSLLIVRGWNAKLTKQGADGGIDVIASRIESGRQVNFAVQVKHWKSNIPAKEVRDFYGACSGVYDRALFVTSSKFSAGALKFIKQRTENFGTPLYQLDGQKLRETIDKLSDEDYGKLMSPLKKRLADRDKINQY